MIINVASFAYFGHFLAHQMHRLGHLGSLFTNLPSSRLSGIPRERFYSQTLLSAPYFFANRLKLHRLVSELSRPTIELFDRWVAANITSCDLFHCFSGFGRKSHQVARERYGAVTIVERGSSHIGFQDNILREEYARWGVPYRGIDQWLLDREQIEYAECDRITVQSSFALRTFIERGVSRNKLIKLPLGVDLKLFRPIKKEDSIFRVLYAGTFSLRKGIPYLLEAVSSLHLSDFEFLANGTPMPEIEHLIRPYSNIIKYTGWRPLDQLCHLYSQASVFVLPTIEDGFAKVITEAMACGVPVIATTNCGAEDLITNGVEGFIVPIRNSEAIREKILLLYENPELRDEMGRAALRRTQSYSGWDSYGESAAKVYTDVLRTLSQGAKTLGD